VTSRLSKFYVLWSSFSMMSIGESATRGDGAGFAQTGRRSCTGAMKCVPMLRYTSSIQPHDLAADTAVTRSASRRAGTPNVPSAWNFRTSSGGVLMTVVVRAMREELGDPELRPVSANTYFCSPVPAGPLGPSLVGQQVYAETAPRNARKV
jgi:hypothetical protein